MHRNVCCSFTGHRPEKLPWGTDENDPRCTALKKHLYKEVTSAYHLGYSHFLCGMARGTDLYFCEAVLRLRDLHSDVKIEAAIPFPKQAHRWKTSEQSRYYQLLDRCNYQTIVQQQYTQGCMHRRNRYMVDHSTRLIAVYNGTGGGTLYTINYANKQDLDIILLPF